MSRVYKLVTNLTWDEGRRIHELKKKSGKTISTIIRDAVLFYFKHLDSQRTQMEFKFKKRKA